MTGQEGHNRQSYLNKKATRKSNTRPNYIKQRKSCVEMRHLLCLIIVARFLTVFCYCFMLLWSSVRLDFIGHSFLKQGSIMTRGVNLVVCSLYIHSF